MINYYNDIPQRMLLDKTVLDIGCGDGSSQLSSKHSHIFTDHCRYYGIDKADLTFSKNLNITRGDILTCTLLPDTFDTVLMMHSLEHIHYTYWKDLFISIKSTLRPNGWLVVACPYNEDPRLCRDQEHVVSRITEDVLEPFIPDHKMYRASTIYPKTYGLKKGVWWFRKFFKGIRSVPFGLTCYSFITFWRKEREEEV